MEPRLSKCTLADIQLLVNLSEKTFRDAFEKDNDPQDFEAYVATAFSVERLRGEIKNPNSSFYFVYLGNTLVGYFKININEAQTDVQDDRALELGRIYISKAFQGKQLGAWALQEVINLTNELDKDYVWLGVWEHNHKAIRFYEKHGFKKFGKHPYYIGNDKQTDWLMRYDLK